MTGLSRRQLVLSAVTGNVGYLYVICDIAAAVAGISEAEQASARYWQVWWSFDEAGWCCSTVLYARRTARRSRSAWSFYDSARVHETDARSVHEWSLYDWIGS